MSKPSRNRRQVRGTARHRLGAHERAELRRRAERDAGEQLTMTFSTFTFLTGGAVSEYADYISFSDMVIGEAVSEGVQKVAAMMAADMAYKMGQSLNAMVAATMAETVTETAPPA